MHAQRDLNCPKATELLTMILMVTNGFRMPKGMTNGKYAFRFLGSVRHSLRVRHILRHRFLYQNMFSSRQRLDGLLSV